MSRRPATKPAPGLCSDERLLASALSAVEVLQSYQQSDARLLTELQARQRANAEQLARIRADLAERLRPAAVLCGALLALCLSAPAAEPAAALPSPPPSSALLPGPLHSATNLAPAEARAALASRLPPPSTPAVARFLAPPAAPAMPAFASSGYWVDAVFLPLGYHELNVGRGLAAPSSVALCSPDYVRAVVWRYRRGTGPRAVPLDLDHASSTNANYALLGRVVGAWFDERRGAVARIELTPSGKAAIEARPMRVSAGMRVLRSSTTVNAALTGGEDEIAIPWALTSIALTRDPALPTPWISKADLRPLSDISVYPRSH